MVDVLMDALQIAAEQRYFWMPAWQAKEREAEKAIAEGQVKTFDSMDEMLDFLETR